MQEQSFQAKLVKECIRLAAGNRLIGPKIKMGELQRHLVDKEPLWRKPEDVLWERKKLANCTSDSRQIRIAPIARWGICESTAQYLSKFCL